MHNSNISGVILEGIAGTGKSSALYEILQSKLWTEKPFISSLVLSEHHTLRVLENKFLDGTISTEDTTSLLDQHVSHLERLKTNLTATDWLERDRQKQKIPYIFERFHLTHEYHYDQVGWADIQSIDSRLKELDAKLVVLTINEDDIQSRIIEDYKKAGWQDYLKTLGSNDREITQHFIDKQKQLLETCKKSELQTIIINTSDNSATQVADQILKFWDLY